MIDFAVLQKLIKLVEESDITGLAVEEGEMRVEIKREKGGVVATAPQQIAGAPVAAISSSAAQPGSPTGSATAGSPLPSNVVTITSPMVGTFYRSSSPEAKSFVQVGDHVDSGKVVCIIEAMKLFNEIESEVKGKITKIMVENGQPVEYGQTLMLVEKEG